MVPIYPIIFFINAALLLIAAVLVITVRNPVHSILSLVLAFFASAILWMMIQAEFLSLVLIFVYVGAVMTLFLFVVMMLNIDLSKTREKFVKFLPVCLLILVVFITTMVLVVKPYTSGHLALLPAGTSNVTNLGILLYTEFNYPVEIAGVILLVAIIAAISLAFYRKPNSRVQRISEQLKATKKDRLRIVSMKADKS